MKPWFKFQILATLGEQFLSRFLAPIVLLLINPLAFNENRSDGLSRPLKSYCKKQVLWEMFNWEVL